MHRHLCRIVVGTTDSSLLLYSIEEEPSFAINLVESKKIPSKKPVEQLCVLKSAGAANGEVLDSGGVGNLCVGLKRKLLVFECSGKDITMKREIAIPDRARTLEWVDREKLVATFYRGYYLVDLAEASVKEILTLGGTLTSALGSWPSLKTTRPTVACLPDGRLMLGKDDHSMFLNADGSPTHDREFQWSSAPEFVVFSAPYVAGLIGSQIEVRSLKTGAVVQMVDLPQIRSMVGSPNVLVTSPTFIWRLLPLDFEDQIEQLIASNQFVQAQRLIEDLEFPTEEDKTANIIRVRGLYAHHIFTNEKRYAEAVSILQELQASPIDVINLYPDLAIDTAEEESTEHVEPSDTKALRILMDYLINQRVVLAKLKQQQEHSGSYEDYPTVADTVYLMEIVDTTLLKVYLRVNKSLVGPLVRIQNYCNLEESEKVLLDNQRYLDLVDLYRGKALHGKALEFLQGRSASSDATSEFDKMIFYMQGMNFDEQIALILKYADWVIRRDAAGGMKVFTEHYDEVSLPTKRKIVDHLEALSPDFANTYLEYLIWEREDATPEMHDRLILSYLKVLVRDMQEHAGYAGPQLPKRPAGDQQTDKGKSFWKTRRKLASFLDQSKIYHAEKVLAVLELIPPTIPLSDLVGYLEKTLHDMHRNRNMDDVVKNLLKAEKLQAQGRLAFYQSRRIVITEERMCSKCLKRISNTVFTVLPSGLVMHAFCALKK
ncbi:Vam6/Vps39-like protein [Rhizophlyctis rosea]|uniref:Vam6/Vps39-like protein n=1 Tax=Rhizophlyctis rosea TaxID=64517 RepID=A0AAD5SKB0_9FUNG|nr:Vam6/Vps39-like protein [Rhizophlyctis rosea]